MKLPTFKYSKSFKPLYGPPKGTNFWAALVAYELVFSLAVIGVAILLGTLGTWVGLSRYDFLSNMLLGTSLVIYFLILPPYLALAARLRSNYCFGFWEGLRRAWWDVRMALSTSPLLNRVFAPPDDPCEEPAEE